MGACHPDPFALSFRRGQAINRLERVFAFTDNTN